MLLIDPESGALVDANEAAVKFYGYSREDLLRLPIWGLNQLPPAEVRQAMDSITPEHGRRFEFQHRRADGSLRNVEVASCVVYSGAKKLLHSIVLDITERKQVEAALRQSEENYRAVVMDQTETIARFRTDGVFAFVNEVFCRVFGKTQEELLGRHWSPRAVAEDLAMIEAKLRTLSPTNPVVVIENRVYDARGEVRWMQFVNRALFNAAGQHVETQSVGRDITERKQMEAALRQSEESYRAVVMDQTETIARIRKDGVLTFVNDVLCRYFGRTREELLGQHWSPRVVSEDVPMIEAKLRTLSPANPVVVIENRVYDAQGEVRWMQFVNRALFNAAGEHVETQSVGRDITERKQAALVMQLAKASYDELVRLIPVGICVFRASADGAWRMEFASPRAAELFGVDVATMLADVRSTTRHAHPDDEPGIWEELRRTIAAKSKFRCEARFNPRGTERWLRMNGLPTVHPNGDIVWNGIVSDITDQRRVEAVRARAIQNSDGLRRAIMELSRFESLNPALPCLLRRALELGGVDSGAIYLIEGEEVALHCEQGLPPEFVPLVTRRSLNAPYLEASAREPGHFVDIVALSPEGRNLAGRFAIRHVLCIALQAQEKVFGFMIVASRREPPPEAYDIEAVRILALEAGALFSRLQAEAELRHRASRIEDLYHNAPCGYHSLDADGLIVEMNNTELSWLGYRRAELVGRRHMAELLTVESRQVFAENYPRFLNGGELRDLELKLVRKDGLVLEVLVNATAIRDAAGRFVLGRTTVVDMTEHNQLEAQARHSQRMESIGRLVGGIAHEFNNILAAMILSMDFMKASGASAGVVEGIVEVERLAARAADMVRQLLALGRRTVLQTEPVEMVDWVSQQMTMLRRLLGERISVELVFQDQGLWVLADPGALTQVLLNLCINARDAMAQGGVLQITLAGVEVAAQSGKSDLQAAGGRGVCLTVADNGCGMDAATLSRLFEPFFTTKDVGQGSGLGLATARGLLEQQQGWMEVESQVGQGSTFRAFWPAIPAPDLAPELPETSPSLTGSGTILLVEDEAALRGPHRALLEIARL